MRKCPRSGNLKNILGELGDSRDVLSCKRLWSVSFDLDTKLPDQAVRVRVDFLVPTLLVLHDRLESLQSTYLFRQDIPLDESLILSDRPGDEHHLREISEKDLRLSLDPIAQEDHDALEGTCLPG
jgi:hypothetical protein